MNAFVLKDFEFKIDPSIWDAAQDLHTAGAVRSLREVEPKFWVALVETADYHVEVEVLFEGLKVRGFTCECHPNLLKMRICAHVAATLIRLRQIFEKEKREREKPIEPKSTSQASKLTVQTILTHAEPEKLADFIREYAANDRDFNLALKTRFAGELPGAADFYGQLLDSLVKPIVPTKVVDADFRRLMRTLGDLDRRQNEENELENFPAVVEMANMILQKLPPLAQKLVPPRRNHLEKFCSSAFRRLVGVSLRRGLAPLLEEEIWLFILEMPSSSLLLPVLHREAFDFFVEKTTSRERFQQIEARADAHFSNSTTAENPSKKTDESFFFQLMAVLFSKQKAEKKLLALLDRSVNFEATYRICQLLFERAEIDFAKKTATHFLEKRTASFFQNRQIEEFLFQIAIKTGDFEGQTAHIRQRFLATGNFEFYQKLKSLAGNDWKTELENLLAALKTTEQTPETARRIGGILAEEGQSSVLAAFIESENSLDLLEVHEAFFIRRDPSSLENLVFKLVGDFLNEHFGRQPAERARDFLLVLKKKSPEIAQTSARKLIEAFADRRAVVEELAPFLGKEERNEWLKKVMND